MQTIYSFKRFFCFLDEENSSHEQGSIRRFVSLGKLILEHSGISIAILLYFVKRMLCDTYSKFLQISLDAQGLSTV
jgi:hypothetical protein